MLQSIRERAQGVIAWIIVILITIPFALWGIQEYLGVGTEPVIATVNGQEITEREFENRYREFRQNLRQRLGRNYRPELLDETELRNQVMDNMIRNAVLIQSSEQLGLSANDEMVREVLLGIPAFQVDGRFNQDAYQRALLSEGLSPAGFDEQVRQSIVADQLASAVSVSELVTRSELENLIRLRLQTRDIRYLIIPTAQVVDEVSVSEDEIKAHYDSNSSRYMAAERAKVEYIDLDIDNISGTLDVSEENLLGYFEQNKEAYRVPEQRRASHILFTLDEGADDSALEQVRQRAQAALQRLNAGESFETLAKELSQDPGSSDMGGDLGYFEPGVMDAAFDEAVFSMSEGDISEPVQSEFGLHIIQLTSIRAEHGKSFEEAREDVQKAYLKSEAEKRFYDYAERLSNLAYEDPNSLQPAADDLGVEIQTSDWVTRDSKEGIFAAPKIIGAVFSEDVLREGNNSEAIELGPEQIVVLRVIEHEESSLKSLDEVTDEIRSLLVKQKSSELTAKLAQELIEGLRAGSTLDNLAEELGLSIEDAGTIDRNARGIPAQIVSTAFRIARPAEGATGQGDVALADGSHALIVVERVTDGTPDQVTELGGETVLGQTLQRSKADQYFRLMLEQMQAASKIEIRTVSE